RSPRRPTKRPHLDPPGSLSFLHHALGRSRVALSLTSRTRLSVSSSYLPSSSPRRPTELSAENLAAPSTTRTPRPPEPPLNAPRDPLRSYSPTPARPQTLAATPAQL